MPDTLSISDILAFRLLTDGLRIKLAAELTRYAWRLVKGGFKLQNWYAAKRFLGPQTLVKGNKRKNF